LAWSVPCGQGNGSVEGGPVNAESFLSGLKKVRRTVPGEWVACCPAHEDRSPSLAVKQADDGRILVHCFAGCSVDAICGAAGILMSDLFPEKLIAERLNPIGFNPRTLLKAMAFNAQIVALLAGDIVEGRSVSNDDLKTVQKIRKEFEEVLAYAAR
jgi:hypothetical protein